MLLLINSKILYQLVYSSNFAPIEIGLCILKLIIVKERKNQIQNLI